MTKQTIVVMVVLVTASGARAQEPPGAKAIYDARCAFCHGPDGKGDGPAGASLKPPPTNFSNPDYWKSASTDSVKNAIMNGKPQTAMVPFGATLSPGEVDGLAAYLKTLSLH